MSDYLSRLAARLADPAAALKPRLPGRFESLPVSRPSLDLEGADVARTDEVAATPLAPRGTPPLSPAPAPAADEPRPEPSPRSPSPLEGDVGLPPQPPPTADDRPPGPRRAPRAAQAAETMPEANPAPIPRPPALFSLPSRAAEVAPTEPPPAMPTSVTPRRVEEMAEPDTGRLAPLVPRVPVAPRPGPADSNEPLEGPTRQPTVAEAAIAADTVAQPAQPPLMPPPAYLTPAPPQTPAGSPAVPSPPQPPVIRVTIGRIEVRAVTPPPIAPPAPRPAPRPPSLSLDDYLKERRGGRR